MYGLAMGFNDMLANGKPQSASACLPASRQIGAIEPFKDPGKVFFRNTCTIITDLDQNSSAIYIIKTGFDCSILFSVFNCIVDKIYKYLPYLFLICINRKGKFATLFNDAPDLFFPGL
jgi:hypothetical protein